MNKNYYEELVDRLMIDVVVDKVSEDKREVILDRLTNLPTNKKRLGILSLLDDNRNLLLSIKELINTPPESKVEHISKLVEHLRTYVKVSPVDIKQFGEVMTPLELVDEMLDTLPEDVWANPHLKWLDPANGCGVFPSTIVKRLMEGLEPYFPSEEERYRHIMEEMIYVCELQPKNMFLHLCAFDPQDTFLLNIYTGSFLEKGFDDHMKNVWGVDKFDIIVGNPPYQEMDGGNAASAKPLYHTFTKKCITISDKTLFVIPSRWMAGGKGLDKFRKEMFTSNIIESIKHYEDSQALFGKSVDIRGGIQILHINNSFKGSPQYNNLDCDFSSFDIFINPVYHSIINKIKNKPNIVSLVRSRSTYPIATNDSNLTDIKITETDLLCYVSQQKGFTKYIALDKITKNIHTINGYKVITPGAAGKGNDGFGNVFLGLPNQVHSDTYIHFKVSNRLEGNNLVIYLNTKFANYLLSLRKISQHIKPDTCKWIPLVDLSKEWTDEELYKHFNLTQEEIKLIEQTVK